MLSIDEYKEYVREHVLDYLPEEYSNAKLEFELALKNNDVRRETLLINNGSVIIPTIYLDQYYKFYKDGDSIDNTLKLMSKHYLDAAKDDDINFISKDYFNFENLKDKIVPVLCNAKKNADRLKFAPHELYSNDLAITYKIIVKDFKNDEKGVASIHINNNHMSLIGINYETLKKTAEANFESHYKPTFKSMHDVLKDMFINSMSDSGMEPAIAEMMFNDEYGRLSNDSVIPMYVLSSANGYDGSVCITSQKVMDEISEKLEGDFMIIPSSIHEVIIIPLKDNKMMDSEEINAMINEINESCVENTDYLSDHVYKYDSEKKLVLEWNSRENYVKSMDDRNIGNRGKSI
ncbi:hypothetical protein SAMN02745111_00314 [Eubacterium uniforme]|uniref:Uncharacterized protein n=1 Tax=Eubacterium uniforme TaxID=39495 RepID=A0A1T4V7W5_9FIRM|nr:DUF5688 family protein [Eubacterium uniforme]SKA60966.1 hypothetical protein SAMN02745111_00314 [Eubacterium uniforme]